MFFKALIVLVMAWSTGFASELCVNGSFEDWSNGVPTGWTKESSVTISRASSPVYDGNYSVGLQATSTTNAGIFQDVSVIPGRAYSFRVALYAVSGTESKGLGFSISWFDSSNAFIRSSSVKYANVLNQWVIDSIVDTAPANAKYARLRIMCYADNTLGGYADFAVFAEVGQYHFPPSFVSITRVPEFPDENEPANVIAVISDPEHNVTACSLAYRWNSGPLQWNGPDSVKDSSYYFHIPSLPEGSSVEYFLTACSPDTSVYSDTFKYQLSGFEFAVYFENNNLPQRLAEFISGARYSLDLAFYEVFNSLVVDSLISAKNRGVRIRVITDSSYINYSGTRRLISAGIPVIHEGIGANSTQHIMHNKFAVRDYWDSDPSNDYVWTGSYNASDVLHVDNGIIIRSRNLAEAYTREFNQMWGSDSLLPDSNRARTGTRKVDVLSSHIFISGNDTLWLYFSPQDNPIQYVCAFASRARSAIAYLIYSFTRTDLRDTLISIHRRGVQVYGVHEDNAGLNPVFDSLTRAGIYALWANVQSPYSLLHAKVMVIDTTYVITGSMNWSNNGTADNDENLLIVRSPNLARIYWDWFKFHFAEAGGQINVIELKPVHVETPKTLIFTGKVNLEAPSCTIYDAMGRLVRDLRDNPIWDGKDDEGREVRSGIYFVRNAKGEVIVKVLKLR